MLTQPTASPRAAVNADAAELLTPAAMAFLARLEHEFGPRREELLRERACRQQAIDAGEQPDFPSETRTQRTTDWRVGSIPGDLQDRRVEITGPTDAKMMINALNCGANVFMADFEDANSPTWTNMIQGQRNVRAAVNRTLRYVSPDGRTYTLNDRIATLMIRPRGWHLHERHVRFKGRDRFASASLFDFGLFVFHNARTLLDNGSGPYLYLPKLENRHEARLWNDVFNFTQDELRLPRGSIKCTVLIETILAAFEMDEILYELRDHIVGLNAGRWDYIFSVIKKFRNRPDVLPPLPDRAQISMTVPFMRAYAQLLVQTCHRRGAHAIGGMAAFIPSRKDPKINQAALAKVREDKLREARDGFDGTWIAHPDLLLTAKAVFDDALKGQPHQKHVLREDVSVSAKDLLNFAVPDGCITKAGLCTNISVSLQYLDAWLRGTGAAAINNLMEDAATAEISRAQLWQWIHHPEGRIEARRKIDASLVRDAIAQQTRQMHESIGDQAYAASRLDQAARLLDDLATSARFAEFLTPKAYELLNDDSEQHELTLESAGSAGRS